ncbi:hypothetical protein F4776DRAFT_591506 [Hypoxylon sp. NC0597]|nr:hypothetical protein F4776DRAFT_591506 [Hypoxylon sp. NC0597]
MRRILFRLLSPLTANPLSAPTPHPEIRRFQCRFSDDFSSTNKIPLPRIYLPRLYRDLEMKTKAIACAYIHFPIIHQESVSYYVMGGCALVLVGCYFHYLDERKRICKKLFYGNPAILSTVFFVLPLFRRDSS